MGRPNKYWQERLAKEREKAMAAMFDLHKDAHDHIRESIIALSVCTYCDSTFKAPKSDAEGKCMKCHGKGVVPDKDQRNWAVEQVTSRTLPKPKQLEVSTDNGNPDETEKLKNVTDEELKRAEAMLNGLLGGTENGESAK